MDLLGVLIRIAAISIVAASVLGQVRTGSDESHGGLPLTPNHPECPSPGSCCVGHDRPGCNNSNCCNIVCEYDYFCCIGWDLQCARWAEQLCLSVCAGSCPGEGDCCAAHAGGGCRGIVCCDQVCRAMPSCCETGWTDACAALAIQVCDECDAQAPFTCPRSGDCCTGRLFGGGCERAGCCEAICSVDPFCCHTAWDGVCAESARVQCSHVCNCEEFGEFDGTPDIGLRDAADFLNCFSGSGQPIAHSACSCADYDGDQDADWVDFEVFMGQLAR